MHRLKFKRFQESRILSSSDKTGKVWEVMVIRAGLSHNSTPPLVRDGGEWIPASTELSGKRFRYHYSAEMLKKAMPLFEGKPAYAFEYSPNQFGHVKGGSAAEIVKLDKGLAGSKIGQYSNPRWGKDDDGGEGIICTLTLVDETISARLLEAWNAGIRNFVEYSIDGDGDFEIVSIGGQDVADVEIREIDSVDMVTAGAAGGKNLRLVAAKEQPNEGCTMKANARAAVFRFLESRKVDQKRSNRILEADDKSALSVAVEELQKEADAMQKAGMDSAVTLVKEAIAALQSGNADVALAALAALQKLVDSASPAAAPAKESDNSPKPSADPAPEKPGQAQEKKPDPQAAAGATVEDVTKIKEELDRVKIQLDQDKAVAAIDASNLPAASKAHLKESVSGRSIGFARIQEAITAEQGYLEKLGYGNAGGIKFGPSGKDHASLALEGMFYNRDVKDADGKVVRRFTSLREAKIKGWGGRHDEPADEFIGSLHARARMYSRLREMLSSDWDVVFASTLYRVFLAEYALPEYNDWRKIVTIETVNDFRDHNFMRIGYLGDLPLVDSDGGNYNDLGALSDEQVALNVSTYGGTMSITRKMIVNDDVNAIRVIPQRMARAAKMGINKAVFGMYTANSGAGATCAYDSVTLIHATSHLNGATSGGSALSAAAFNACRKAMMIQKAYGSDTTDPEYLGEINLPRWLIIPPDLEPQAEQICGNQFVVEAASTSGEYPSGSHLPATGMLNIHAKKKNLDYIIVPSWTDADNWYAQADPNKVPGIAVAFLKGQEEPDIEQEAANTGSDFTARKLTYRISHDRGVKVVDHRATYGQVV